LGGGAAALALASYIDASKYEVHIYEKNKALARKFLVAGDGGFNLTHGSSIQDIIKQYEPQGFLDDALRQFSNDDFREWLKETGIETYVGSSGRVFPIKSIKPININFLKILKLTIIFQLIFLIILILIQVLLFNLVFHKELFFIRINI
jgi:predicted flavoprotein YhiN